MKKKLPLFYSASLLTVVSLLLRMAGTGFQVYVSNRIGAQGVGLLQLVLSVGFMAMTAGTAGIRTTTMYLTAEKLGQKQASHIPWLLHGCFRYSIITSTITAILLYMFSIPIAGKWIGSAEAVPAIKLVALSIPLTCFVSVLTGYYTAAGRISVLAAVEVTEQLIAIVLTVVLFETWVFSSLSRACQAVVMGSIVGSIFTLLALIILNKKEYGTGYERYPIGRKIISTAFPLAAADDLRTGISTAENMMVPKRLSLCSAVSEPMAVFGIVCGMVFPVLMLPAVILFSLGDLLISEIARCHASGSIRRIQYLTNRSMRVSLIYGGIWGGILFSCGTHIGNRLFQNQESGAYLVAFSLLVPMLYCDALTDAITKGMGQQKACVKYNIITSSIDLISLYFLLPIYGMKGYFFSFFVSHALNFFLSMRRLLKITRCIISFRFLFKIMLSFFAAILISSFIQNYLCAAGVFIIIFFCNLTLSGVAGLGDIKWIFHMMHKKRST